jgi:hypothetical protein
MKLKERRACLNSTTTALWIAGMFAFVLDRHS